MFFYFQKKLPTIIVLQAANLNQSWYTISGLKQCETFYNPSPSSAHTSAPFRHDDPGKTFYLHRSHQQNDDSLAAQPNVAGSFSVV